MYDNEEIKACIDDLYNKCDFIANIKFIIPSAHVPTALHVMSTHADLLSQRNLSWRIEHMEDDSGAIVIEFDRTNYPHWRRRGRCDEEE